MHVDLIFYDFSFEEAIMRCSEHVCSGNGPYRDSIPDRDGLGEQDLPPNRDRDEDEAEFGEQGWGQGGVYVLGPDPKLLPFLHIILRDNEDIFKLLIVIFVMIIL